MGYNALETALRELLAQVERWRLTDQVPAIERDMALGRLQQLYAGLQAMRCSAAGVHPEAAPAPEQQPDLTEADSADTVEIPNGAYAPSDESFEPERDTLPEDTSAGDDFTHPSDPVEPPCADEKEAGPKAPESIFGPAPHVFGIEITQYSRHEMINTLFRGDATLFESECAKIDAMDNLEEALIYIGGHYHWIPDNAATNKFIDLLEQRFA